MTEPKNTNKRYGKLIGASLGPGDPELITRRAWTALTFGGFHLTRAPHVLGCGSCRRGAKAAQSFTPPLMKTSSAFLRRLFACAH